MCVHCICWRARIFLTISHTTIHNIVLLFLTLDSKKNDDRNQIVSKVIFFSLTNSHVHKAFTLHFQTTTTKNHSEKCALFCSLKLMQTASFRLIFATKLNEWILFKMKWSWSSLITSWIYDWYKRLTGMTYTIFHWTIRDFNTESEMVESKKKNKINLGIRFSISCMVRASTFCCFRFLYITLFFKIVT